MTKYENNSKWNSNAYIPFAGDASCLFLLANDNNNISSSSSSSSLSNSERKDSSSNGNHHFSIYIIYSILHYRNSTTGPCTSSNYAGEVNL